MALKQVAPRWNRRTIASAPALTQSQIEELSVAYELPPDASSSLIAGLNHALLRSTKIRGISFEPNSPELAKERMASVLKDLRAAEKKISSAADLVHTIEFNNIKYDKDNHDTGYYIRSKLLDLKLQLIGSLNLCESLSKGNISELKWRQKKQRRSDYTRGFVCRAIFSAWEKAGRPLSYTSDPITNERKGRLIEFTNEVVACVSTPPSRLHGETIRKEIEAYKELKKFQEEVFFLRNSS